MIKTPPSQLHHQVLHLASWPPLSLLLQDTVPDATRICALLARRPSVGMLIPLMLDIPPQLAHSLLATLHAHGHIYPETVASPDKAAALPEAAPTPPKAPLERSVLSKLWLRFGKQN